MSKITVHLQIGDYPNPSKDRTFCMPLKPIQRYAIMPLDFPSASSGIFCTPESTVKTVLKQRELTARELTTAILALMRSSDTYDGCIPVDPLTGHPKGL